MNIDWDAQWGYVFIGIMVLVLPFAIVLSPFFAVFWLIGRIAKKIAPKFWSPIAD